MNAEPRRARLGLIVRNACADALALLPSGRTPLFYAAGYGHEDYIVDLLNRKETDATITDVNGDTALHFAAVRHPMAAYLIAQAAPSCVLASNKNNITPIDVAVSSDRGEVRTSGTQVSFREINCPCPTPSVQACNTFKAL